MPRLALLVLSAALAGCASTSLVDAANPADIARVQAREYGRTADITLTSGDLYRGALVFLRADSTAWEDAAGLFAVPTGALQSLVIDAYRPAMRRGGAIGAPVGFGICFSIFAGADASGAPLGFVLGAVCAPIGAFVGVLGGAASGRHTTYVFAPHPTGEAGTAPPPGGAPAGGGE